MKWYKVFDSKIEAIAAIQDGKGITVEVDDVKLCLFRKGEKLIATDYLCPHQGAPIHKGWCDEQNNIVCPYHRFKFDPNTGRDISSGGNPLKIYPVEIRQDGIFIGFPSKKAWWKLF